MPVATTRWLCWDRSGRSGWTSWPRIPAFWPSWNGPANSSRATCKKTPGTASIARPKPWKGSATPIFRQSLVWRIVCPSTQGAWGFWPGITSRRPATWACRWWEWACSTKRDIFASTSTPTAGSRSAIPLTISSTCLWSCKGMRRAARFASRWITPNARYLPASGRRWWGGCLCIFWTPTSSPTASTTKTSPMSCTAATRMCASTKRSCWGSAGCRLCAPSGSIPPSTT